MSANNIARFMRFSHASLQKTHLLTTPKARSSYSRREGFGKAIASFSSATSSTSPEEKLQQFPPSYEPCLLLSHELVPLFDGSYGHSVSYTFYSLKDDKIIKKVKQVNFPSEQRHLLPRNARLFGSSHGWLAYYIDRSEDDYTDHIDYEPFYEPIYLMNPSLPLSDQAESFDVPYTFYRRQKFTMSSPLQLQSLCNDGSKATSTTMVILDEQGRPEFYEFEPDDNSYRNDGYDYDRYCYEDIVYFKKHQKFYCLQNGFEVLFTLSRDPITRFMRPSSILPMFPYNSEKYYRRCLVESSGNLLMVTEYNSKVHKVNFEEQKWEPVECLGDHALFLGVNDSFSLSTHEYPYLKRNTIYNFKGEVINLEDGSSSNVTNDGVWETINSIDAGCALHNWVMVDVGTI